MNRWLFLSVAFLVIILQACNKKNEKQDADVAGKINNEKYFPIEGNWELVSAEVNGEQSKPSRTLQQFKMF